jgi:hypothetical protein
MRAKLKRLHSPDIANLATYVPEASDSFSFLLQLIVGPEDSDGEESFDVLVCTPEWLRGKRFTSEFIVGRHYLIVFEYNYDRLLTFMDAYCSKCVGETWQTVAEKLSRLGKWEFEDYKPAPGPPNHKSLAN